MRPLGEDGYDQFIFLQELNEVYLLLDFISGRPDKHLSSLDQMIDDVGDAPRKMTVLNVIERVSALRYPPAPLDVQKAQDAAFLLKLKDCLNCIAYPARGLTIAYTIMFTEEPRGERGYAGRRGLFPSSAARKTDPEPMDGRLPPTQLGGPPVNRSRLAQLAFPSLVSSAASFRRVKDSLAWLALVITVLSATFFWQVTYGAQMAGRFDDAKRLESEAAAKLYMQLDHEKSTNAAVTIPLDLTRFCSLPPDPQPVVDPSAKLPHPTSSNGEASDNTMSSTTRQLCNDYAYRHALLSVAIDDVGHFGRSWIFRVSDWLLPIHPLCQGVDCGSSAAPVHVGRQEDAQSIAAVLAMMTNYILPILFGLVGTMAAMVRGIQDKVTESVLAPRDKALSLIRLPLGMMAGVCVGLFYSPSTLGTVQNGSIANFTLSASGIAFLAGYGAEGFFRMLDLLITRVFSLRENEPRNYTRSP